MSSLHRWTEQFKAQAANYLAFMANMMETVWEETSFLLEQIWALIDQFQYQTTLKMMIDFLEI